MSGKASKLIDKAYVFSRKGLFGIAYEKLFHPNRETSMTDYQDDWLVNPPERNTQAADPENRNRPRFGRFRQGE